MPGAAPAAKAQDARKPRDYESLLAEASRIQGVSLWKDAWRRLRKNRAAMASLGFLIGLALLSFFTPVLPLQSPQKIWLDEERQYQPPSFKTAELPIGLEDLAAHQQAMAKLQQEVRAATGEERSRLTADLESLRRDSPLSTLWNSPGPLGRFLIALRVRLFGNWAVPSILGTDELGRDVLSRIMWGSRVSLIVGILATLVSLVIGVSWGSVAGYCGGWIDAAMMRIVDILYSVPFIFIVIFAITILSEDKIKTWLLARGINQIAVFYILIGAIYWLTMARVVRGQIISLKHEQFVDAARTIGAGTPRIVFRHLVPNVLGIVIVYLTLTIPSVMLFEAFLSFLGLGVQPPDVSWGLLANDGIKVITPIQTYWWLVVFPGLALALTLFALNFLGDGLRDALDPRLKNR
jgi:oligopeptide transport system permease protein